MKPIVLKANIETYILYIDHKPTEDLKGLFKLASLAINMYLFSIIEFIQTPFSRQLQLLTKQNRLSSPTRWSPVSENLLILTCLYSGRTMDSRAIISTRQFNSQNNFLCI